MFVSNQIKISGFYIEWNYEENQLVCKKFEEKRTSYC